MTINDYFIDNFKKIFLKELKVMKDLLFKYGIEFTDDEDVIYIYREIENLSPKELSEWKKGDLKKDGETDECLLAGILLIQYQEDIDCRKLQNFFNKINYYDRVYLAYKMNVL